MENIEITTYEQACQVNKQEPTNLPDVSMLPENEAKDVINSLKLKRIVRALNTNQETGEVWEPNWNNDDEVKYFPWVEVKASEEQPGGFGFSTSDYDYWNTNTSVGSRLALQTSEKVMHLHKHFEQLLIECMLILK